MNDFILQSYNDFKIFMDIKNGIILPRINPILVNDNENKTYAHVNSDEIKNDVVNLYYINKLSNFHETFQKSILFHEFTHILDSIMLSRQYSGKTLNALLNTYSEYHASQIELSINIGFKNIHSYYKIDLDKTYIHNENEFINITSDYIRPLSSVKTIIDAPKNSYFDLSTYNYYSYYKEFETKSMYYLGKKNLCLNISVQQMPDLTKTWYGEFYPVVYTMEQAIINKKFDMVLIARERLFQKYYNVFPFKNIENLLNELASY